MNLIYNPISTVTPDIYNILPQEDIKENKCVNCGNIYCEFENMGQLDCDIHPGVRVYNTKTNTFYYTCCKNDVTYGCMKSDHMNIPLSLDASERIKELKMMVFMVMPQILTQYGYWRPRSENILLWLNKESSRIIEIKRQWQWCNNEYLYINSKDAIKEISQMMEKDNVLQELTNIGHKRNELKMNVRSRLNERWQDELSKTSQNNEIKIQFTPLLIIRRLEI